MLRSVLVLFGPLSLMAAAAAGGELGFLEDFALAPDRTVPLKQLIPGTEDYYYYHALHYQNTEQFDQVDGLLKPWIERYQYTNRVREILNRQALLTYPRDRAKALEYLRQQLGVQFNHQREIVGATPNLPTRLDDQLIRREPLTQQALSAHRNLDGFEDRALEWLVSQPLDVERRRNLLERLGRPDFPELVGLVIDDLNQPTSGGFGSLPIHHQLLTAQLDECLKRKPELRNQGNFVQIYLAKLQPNGDVDPEREPEERRAYLDRLWQFVSTLDPVHNSLKAHVLYHRLVFDRSLAIYDQERFRAYIQLPRAAGYMNPEYLRQEPQQRFLADLNSDFQAVTGLRPVGDDEALVRSFLQHFFVAANSYEAYATFLHDAYLKRQFAETKIVNGLGDGERWFSLLPPAEYQALKDRVDLDFAFTSHKFYAAAEPVSLDVYVKNVETLLVKVFEVNTGNYYRENLREVDTDINLDGLVANSEQTFKYTEPALRRVLRHFEFPQLSKAGVYVVDFIGNGKSSRALIRKGRWSYVQRTSTAGHVFTVIDELNQPVPDATLWLRGQYFTAGENGTIVVPYSNEPGRQPIVLSRGDFASLAFFEHQSENYELVAGIYVDRESLLQRKTAEVAIRPSLRVNGVPVTLSVLENVTLVITSTDLDGVSTTKEVANLELAEDRETLHEFQVPARLAQLQFTLKARVQNRSQNKKVDVADTHSVALNEIDRTDKIEQLHLLRFGSEYVLELTGKTGEPRPQRAVQLALKHREFRNPVNVTLQTDARGRTALGTLPGIDVVTATGPEQTTRSWPIERDQHSQYGSVNARHGDPIELPYVGTAPEPARDEFSLLEVRGGTYANDQFSALRLRNGMLVLEGLPPGDYRLFDKQAGTQVEVRVARGAERAGYVLGPTRRLELRGVRPLNISRIVTTDQEVRVELTNHSPFSRVHLFATRYEGSYRPFDALGRVRDAEPAWMTAPAVSSWYVAGREIGDELRYILDRRFAKKFPGNLLARPSLLLNPWVLRQTETRQQMAQEGELFDRAAESKEEAAARPGASERGPSIPSDFANLDFLGEPAVVLLNLETDESGAVVIPRSELGPHGRLVVVAIDPDDTVVRTIGLPEAPMPVVDLRLEKSLDSNVHYSQQKRVSIVAASQTFTLADIGSARFEAYDSIAKVYALYVTLSNDPKLVEFSFIANWQTLKPEEKREKYSKYACHELSFFLARKDPEFFQQVVVPFLTNKKDKTFLDRWLLQESLADQLPPWNYEQLNTVERVLLGQRLADERPYAARSIRELFELIPPDVERWNFLFNTALKSSALDTGDSLGFRERQLQEQAGKTLEFDKAPGGGPMGSGSGMGGGAGGMPGMPAPAAAAAPEAPAEDSALRLQVEALEKAKDAKGDRPALARKMRRSGGADRDGRYFAEDAERLGEARQFFQKLDKTQEWAENNYYQLPIEQQNANLVTPNAFWKDYAEHDPQQPFFSKNLAEASRNFTEIMLALAVLDLPFEAAKHEAKFDKSRMDLAVNSPLIVFHEEILPVGSVAEQTPILVSQNFFQQNDRYRIVNNEQLDKFVTDEFLVHTVYGCQIVVTNPTSSRQKLDVLLQVPQGAIPVLQGQATRSVHLDLEPYHTQSLEYHFYFPLPGKFTHYPVQIAKNEELLAFAQPMTLQVVSEPTKVDRESWVYVSQQGTNDDVLAFLEKNNLHRLDLEKIAFRMNDAPFFQAVTRLLAQRHVYHHTLWSYGLKLDVPAAIREYLAHSDAFVNQCGLYLQSPLLDVDPVQRKLYQHLDYRPLVNARAHSLGGHRQILNDRFSAQYDQLLKVLSYHRQLTDDQQLAVTYYLLLQDRVAEAQEHFGRVNADKLATRMQYDYFTAYFNFFLEDPAGAQAVAEKYAEHPVDRWKNVFADVRNQAMEITSQQVQVSDPEQREQVQTKLAATEPSFDFRVEARQVRLDYQNLSEVLVNYYVMDIELLFSRNPFVQADARQFAFIRPNFSQAVALPANQANVEFEIPATLHNSNLLIEVVGAGESKSVAYYSNSLALQVIENYGQLRVTDARLGGPLAGVYVKVYAQMQDGSVQYFKDGYTDLRGRFDYASLSTNQLDFVQKFSILILSDEQGAVIRETPPPKR